MSNLKSQPKQQVKFDSSKIVRNVQHWYECKVEIDGGASKEEHQILKKVKQLILENNK